MPLDEQDLKYMWDMLDAARRAAGYVAGMTKEQYADDEKTCDATERAIEIIGEAARRVSDGARAHLPDVPWGAIVATRHILAHEYGEIDHDRIPRIATLHAPELIEMLRPFLDANPPGPESEMDPTEP